MPRCGVRWIPPLAASALRNRFVSMLVPCRGRCRACSDLRLALGVQAEIGRAEARRAEIRDKRAKQVISPARRHGCADDDSSARVQLQKKHSTTPRPKRPARCAPQGRVISDCHPSEGGAENK